MKCASFQGGVVVEPMEITVLEARLLQWGEWARQGRPGPRPLCGLSQYGRPVRAIQFDAADERAASAVDVAVTQVSKESKMLLVAYFVHRATLASIAQRVGCHRNTLADRKRAAMREVSRYLKTHI